VLWCGNQRLSPQQLLDAVTCSARYSAAGQEILPAECPEIHYVSNLDKYPDGTLYSGAGYHTDHSNAARPPKATVLHAVKLRIVAATRSM